MTCPDSGCTYPNSRNVVPEKNVVGKVISHSTTFGNVLGVVQSTWFIPVAVLAPLTIIAIMSAIDMIKESKKAEKEEEAEVAASLAKAGIDPNDERAVLMFQEKERYKIEIAKTMEKTKEEEKKKMRQQIDKEKKRLKKEMKKEAKSQQNKESKQ
jgi:nucleotide-binding universal stress UspA family protein